MLHDPLQDECQKWIVEDYLMKSGVSYDLRVLRSLEVYRDRYGVDLIEYSMVESVSYILNRKNRR